MAAILNRKELKEIVRIALDQGEHLCITYGFNLLAVNSENTLDIEITSPDLTNAWRSISQAFPYSLKDCTVERGEKTLRVEIPKPLKLKSKPGPKSQELVDIHLQIPVIMWTALDTFKRDNGKPINQLIREAIDLYLRES